VAVVAKPNTLTPLPLLPEIMLPSLTLDPPIVVSLAPLLTATPSPPLTMLVTPSLIKQIS
jgi:hypothetical protein